MTLRNILSLSFVCLAVFLWLSMFSRELGLPRAFQRTERRISDALR